MGTRTDAALATLVLAAVGIAFVLVDASLSPLAVALGGLGTIVFELVAARAYETVRDYWERPLVEGLSLIATLIIVAVGATAAPEVVLSLFCGGAVTYLAFLALVETGVVPPPETWW
ncbi:hypothetical protein JMJ58_11885 [Haloterrigena salifodinae]|uniref:Uncharacterized protein n=1 Tax=Haloterrigena salifodinae TaxID=2675099 RepID=A0A8T8DW57_9EURY|nr:hypothetical protein [Haloterrigena salifodinae]QRV13655.1 hypothetical protein JMJ58_11885 [Haloterrigena salifodinae]